jgi:hypothetical protein
MRHQLPRQEKNKRKNLGSAHFGAQIGEPLEFYAGKQDAFARVGGATDARMRLEVSCRGDSHLCAFAQAYSSGLRYAHSGSPSVELARIPFRFGVTTSLVQHSVCVLRTWPLPWRIASVNTGDEHGYQHKSHADEDDELADGAAENVVQLL